MPPKAKKKGDGKANKGSEADGSKPSDSTEDDSKKREQERVAAYFNLKLKRDEARNKLDRLKLQRDAAATTKEPSHDTPRLLQVKDEITGSERQIAHAFETLERNGEELVEARGRLEQRLKDLLGDLQKNSEEAVALQQQIKVAFHALPGTALNVKDASVLLVEAEAEEPLVQLAASGDQSEQHLESMKRTMASVVLSFQRCQDIDEKILSAKILASLCRRERGVNKKGDNKPTDEEFNLMTAPRVLAQSLQNPAVENQFYSPEDNYDPKALEMDFFAEPIPLAIILMEVLARRKSEGRERELETLLIALDGALSADYQQALMIGKAGVMKDILEVMKANIERESLYACCCRLLWKLFYSSFNISEFLRLEGLRLLVEGLDIYQHSLGLIPLICDLIHVLTPEEVHKHLSSSQVPAVVAPLVSSMSPSDSARCSSGAPAHVDDDEGMITLLRQLYPDPQDHNGVSVNIFFAKVKVGHGSVLERENDEHRKQQLRNSTRRSSEGGGVFISARGGRRRSTVDVLTQGISDGKAQSLSEASAILALITAASAATEATQEAEAIFKMTDGPDLHVLNRCIDLLFVSLLLATIRPPPVTILAGSGSPRHQSESKTRKRQSLTKLPHLPEQAVAEGGSEDISIGVSPSLADSEGTTTAPSSAKCELRPMTCKTGRQEEIGKEPKAEAAERLNRPAIRPSTRRLYSRERAVSYPFRKMSEGSSITVCEHAYRLLSCFLKKFPQHVEWVHHTRYFRLLLISLTCHPTNLMLQCLGWQLFTAAALSSRLSYSALSSLGPVQTLGYILEANGHRAELQLLLKPLIVYFQDAEKATPRRSVLSLSEEEHHHRRVSKENGERKEKSFSLDHREMQADQEGLPNLPSPNKGGSFSSVSPPRHLMRAHGVMGDPTNRQSALSRHKHSP